jgi:hypothetical protein
MAFASLLQRLNPEWVLPIHDQVPVRLGFVRTVQQGKQHLLPEAIPFGNQVSFRTAGREFPEFGNGGAQT